jgi:hypothetical protein
MQWSKVDGERRALFEQRRNEMLSVIQQKVKPYLEPGGNAKAAIDAKMRLIESYAGIKKLNECRLELEKKRRHYCEYFLPAELKALQEISVVVKRRMLEMYVKVSLLDLEMYVKVSLLDLSSAVFAGHGCYICVVKYMYARCGVPDGRATHMNLQYMTMVSAPH